MSSVKQELWSKVIEDNLYTDLIASVGEAATNDSENLNATKVYIPQAGTPGTILKDPVRPLAVAERSDGVLSYDLNEWVIPPSLVKFANRFDLPYDKLASLLKDATWGLNERIVRELCINWYTNQNMVETTGGDYPRHAPGAATSSTYKGLTLDDINRAGAILDSMKYPANDRYLIVDNVMFMQLIDTLGVQSARDAAIINQSTLDMPPISGFKIVRVSAVAFAQTGGTVRPYGHAGATTDKAIALAVHKSAISYAVGNVEIMLDKNNPIYVGDIISGAVYAGGKYRRSDYKGVVPIIQGSQG